MLTVNHLIGFGAAGGGAGGAAETSDPHWASVAFLAQPLAGAGSYAADATGKPLSYIGDAALNAAAAVPGGASIIFDGAGDGVSTPYNTGFQFDGDFTIEVVASLNSGGALSSLIGISQGGGAVPKWAIIANANATGAPASGMLSFAATNMANANAGAGFSHTFASGVPRAIAVKRSGTTASLWVDGAQIGSWTMSGVIGPATAQPLYLGRDGEAYSHLAGKIYAVRITKGVARAIAAPSALWPTAA